jgi:pimeloyl-ACP methyl ester carboxylesterase
LILNKLHYIKWGEGSKLLLAFHGYGNDAYVFRPFERHLRKEYTVLSFDLPHHGESRWDTGVPLTKNDLTGIVKSIMAEYKTDKISLLGYSMGGRVCLALIEQLPGCIDRAALIATDGLATDHYYHFFTQTFIGKKMFRDLIARPKKYLHIAEWLKKKKLVSDAQYKFASRYINTPESRDFLAKVWPDMNRLVPDLARVKAGIKKYRIPVSLFMGAHDGIIPPSRGERFKKGLDTVQLYVLDKGHRVFDEGNAGDIAKSFL